MRPVRLLRLGAAGLCALAVAGVAAGADDDPARLRHKQEQLEKLKATARDLAEQLEHTRSRKASARQAVFDLEEKIGSLRDKRRANRKSLEAVRARLEKLGDRRSTLRDRIGDQQRQLAAYLRAAYRNGDHGFLRQLFGHADPGAVRRSLTYLGYLHRARSELVAGLRADRERLAGVMEEVRAKRDQAKHLSQRLAAQKAELDDRLGQRQSLLDRLSSRAQRQQERLAEVRSDQQALRQVIGRLENLRDRGILVDVDDKRMADLKGRLPLPVAPARILARFGAPREQKSLRWKGVLLGAQPGSDVHAVFRGRVAYAERLRGYGLLIIIDHGDGLLSLYAHNRVLYKEVGEWVDTGEVIAAVGSTGGRRRTATYFEIRRDGKPVNPMQWCRAPGDNRGS
ncbi:MAG TPA: peptidoglycan DD-metalloendopeptidase family protein [Gammaproteobacteria bacterium]|nr:peptidoglycan DD-metalloendopeptidase family protein [Gammaproteobacteria bacterium]